jgi:hypothetical protein
VTKSQAIQKCLKIKALTTSPLSAEAEAARGHLQRLLARYGLTEADLVEKPTKPKLTVPPTGKKVEETTWADLGSLFADV